MTPLDILIFVVAIMLALIAITPEHPNMDDVLAEMAARDIREGLASYQKNVAKTLDDRDALLRSVEQEDIHDVMSVTHSG